MEDKTNNELMFMSSWLEEQPLLNSVHQLKPRCLKLKKHAGEFDTLSQCLTLCLHSLSIDAATANEDVAQHSSVMQEFTQQQAHRAISSRKLCCVSEYLVVVTALPSIRRLHKERVRGTGGQEGVNVGRWRKKQEKHVGSKMLKGHSVSAGVSAS